MAHDYFGTRVVDDYEWLEEGASAEVKAFSEAQSSVARAYLDGLPERPALRARVAELVGATSPDWKELRYVAAPARANQTGGVLFALERQPPKQWPVLVAIANPGALGEEGGAGTRPVERVVVDPNVLDPTGHTEIDFFVPSPDGKLVAISLSKNGSESGDVHVFDAASGKETGDVIPRVNGGTAGGSVAWNTDGSGFYFTRYPRAGERAPADLDFYQQVWFHRIGGRTTRVGDGDGDGDVYVLGKEFPRIAEVELERSPDGRFVLVRVSNGDGGEVEQHVLPGAGPGAGKAVRLSHFSDELSTATFGPDGRIYAASRKGAPRGKVVVFAPPFEAPPELLAAESEGVIEDLVVTSSALYVVEIASGPSRVRRVPLGAKAEPLAHETEPEPRSPKRATAARKQAAPAAARRSASPQPAPSSASAPVSHGLAAAELPLPAVSSVAGVVRVGDDLLLRIESYVEPPAWWRYRANEHRLVKTALAQVAPADMSDVEAVRETCTSKDGTRVPMTVLRRKGMSLDGNAPALLTGYGGFGASTKPRLRPWTRIWLDHGGIYAEANLRGGGELGEDWHRAGNLLNKQNVFDDFAGCAQALFDRHYTRPARLAITGRSNGGLLMGASLVQHPEMFRVVVSGVGLYDMLRFELTPNGVFNVTEYGSIKDEAQFRALWAYSPIHGVKDGTAYPSILLTTGENDTRVDPFQSRKMAARLQAATASDRPVLLLTKKDAGHGIHSPLSVEIDDRTDELAFLLHALEVEAPAPNGK